MALPCQVILQYYFHFLNLLDNFYTYKDLYS